MYSGIVQGMAEIIELADQPGLRTLDVRLPQKMLKDLAVGASVALDGVCMTVTQFKGQRVQFDAMQQTLDLTTLNGLKQGDFVNVERSVRLGDEMGGHELSGHIDTQAEIVAIDRSENNCRMTYCIPQRFMPYVFDKGFVAINGCSLTVAEVNKVDAQLVVSFIPETLRATTHANKALGDHVNIELDKRTQAIVDTVRQYLKEHETSRSAGL